MNWDRMEGEWKQRRGKAVQHWGKVMNDDLAAIAGKYEELVGRLQERYGIAREEANRLKKSNRQLMRLQKSLHHRETAERKRVSSRNHVRGTARRRPGG